jgi:dimethylhistidine N-methyltransferase
MQRSIAEIVRRGLLASPKALPPFLFYDDRGSALFEQITALPEYYVTRTERSIFDANAEVLAAELSPAAPAGSRGGRGSVAILELGAGNASKTQTLLRAFARRQGRTRYFPADVSPAALADAAERVSREEPDVAVTAITGTHGEALAALRRWEGALVVLFIGSSIGNYDDDEAAALLRDIRGTLRDRGALLLGTDLRKPLDVLLPAYDDAQGVTAAFNKNVLSRINRELEGGFDLDSFRHVALWNEGASRIEMHLESLREQRVRIAALGLDVHFAPGERIHTESSQKYDDARVDRLLRSADLKRARSFRDLRGWFAVHLVRPI